MEEFTLKEVINVLVVLNLGVIALLYPVSYTFLKNLIDSFNRNYKKDPKIDKYTKGASALLSISIFPTCLGNLLLFFIVISKLSPKIFIITPLFSKLIEWLLFFLYLIPVIIFRVVYLMWRDYGLKKAIVVIIVLSIAALVNLFFLTLPYGSSLWSCKNYGEMILHTNYAVIILVLLFLILSSWFRPLDILREAKLNRRRK